MTKRALLFSLLIAVEIGSAGTGSFGRPAPTPSVGCLEYEIIYREPDSTGTAANVPRRSGRRPLPQTRLQKSRHQIWFKGALVRVDMTSEPPGAPLARAGNVSVGYIRSDGKPSTLIVPDGYSLIHNAQGTFLFRRGAGDAARLTSRREPFLIPLHGILPSLPVIDRSLLSRCKPGKVG